MVDPVESCPLLTVYSLAGNEVWGPRRVAPGTKAADLARQLDRPAASPGLKLVHGESVLDLDADLSTLGNPIELHVHFDPPKPLDHSFVRGLVDIAERSAHREVCFGDIIPPDAVHVPQATVLHCEALDDGDRYGIVCFGLRLLVKEERVLSREGAKEKLRLEAVTVGGLGSLVGYSLVKADVLEEGLVVLAKARVFFRDFPELEMVDGPVEALVRREQAKVVREAVSFESNRCVELLKRMNGLVEELKKASPADYHPGTEIVVRDLVHPSLFPYVKGVSATGDLSDVAEQAPRTKWGRAYEGSSYQWLPSEVSVDAEGRCCFRSYINNLDEDNHGALYRTLEELLGRCLPHLEAAWAYGSYEDKGFWDCEQLEDRSLRSRSIQVITKIVDYELPTGGSYEGVWHVEGMSHESIVATAEVILRKDACLTGGDLMFQRAFTEFESGMLVASIQEPRGQSLEKAVGKKVVPLGMLPLPEGRLACWPNSHIHKVSELRNGSKEEAVRRIVVFWLVDPEVRIVSTKHVKAQQGTMPMEEALRHREVLMQERRYEKQNWNLREVDLCEH